MHRPPISIEQFASVILGKPLYPYQLEIAEAILESIFASHGRIFTVMLARQSGKNQLSAILEAYLLTFLTQGTIVKAAPTFHPQIINSRLRLLSMLNSPLTRSAIWQSEGYIIGLAASSDPLALRNHTGPRVMFFSASPESNVVGATADLLLEIDEAQDVLPEKFDRDFRPMAATTNATTILYGTAWSDTTLLAQQRAMNLASEQKTGVRQHFEYDWHTLAALNPAYLHYVEQEIVRLGEDNVSIQTQYFLRPISGAGYFFTPLQRTLLAGDHCWQEEPDSDDCYIAAMDVGGEARLGEAPLDTKGQSSSSQRDSTVLTIGRVRYNELHMPVIEVVHHAWWTGLGYPEQYSATIALCNLWGVRVLSIDASGLGEGLASLLCRQLGTERVHPFKFSRASKSELAFQLIALINSGRLKLYTQDKASQRTFEECWKQVRLARYRLPAPQILNIYVDPTDGHDDFLISLALLTDALNRLTPPAFSTLVPATRFYQDESPF